MAKQQPTASTNIVPAQQGEDILAALGEGFNIEEGGGFGFDARFRVPAIKFNDDDHPGQLFNKVTEEAVDKMDVIFLYAQQYRDYSVTHDEGKTYDRLCSSDDTRTGFGTIEESKESRKCKGCPHAEWKSVDGKRIKPDCNEGFGVVGTDLTSEALFLMRFQVTGYAAFQKLREKYHGPQKLGTKRVKELPLWMRRYEVKLKKADGKKYYLPVIDPLNPPLIEPGQAKDVYEAAKMVSENFDAVMSFHRTDAPQGDDGEGAPSTSFNTDDFVDATAESAA